MRIYEPCVYCKDRGLYRDDLSGGESYCTCSAGKQLLKEDLRARSFDRRLSHEYADLRIALRSLPMSNEDDR
jgi:hypothetical protein